MSEEKYNNIKMENQHREIEHLMDKCSELQSAYAELRAKVEEYESAKSCGMLTQKLIEKLGTNNREYIAEIAWLKEKAQAVVETMDCDTSDPECPECSVDWFAMDELRKALSIPTGQAILNELKTLRLKAEAGEKMAKTLEVDVSRSMRDFGGVPFAPGSIDEARRQALKAWQEASR